MSDREQEIRERWCSVGDAFAAGGEIPQITLLLTYASDVRELLDMLAAERAARQAAEQAVKTVWSQFRFQDAAKATAQAELHAALAQLAEERAARLLELEATTRLAESQHRYVELAEQRNQQIAALREARQAALLALDADCMALCDSNTSSAPCSCWPDRLDRARRALLETPAADLEAE